MSESVNCFHFCLSAGFLALATVYISVSVFVRTREKGGEEEKRFEGLTRAAAGWVIKFFNLDLL